MAAGILRSRQLVASAKRALIVPLLLIVSAPSGCGGRSDRHSAASPPDDPSRAGSAGSNSTAGGTSGSGTGGSGTGGGTSGAGGGVTITDAILEIPLDPRHTNSLALYLDEGEASLEPALPHELSMALGDGYPTGVTFDLAGSFIFRENDGLFDATKGLALTKVKAVAGQPEAYLVDSTHFQVGVRTEGDFMLALEGTWTPYETGQPPARAFSAEVLLKVRRVASVDWVSCSTSPVYLVAGAPFLTGYQQPRDSDGLAFSPANASGARSATLSVHARTGTQLSVTDGLATLVAVGADQTVSIRHEGVEIGNFELVDPARIDGLRTHFLFSASWIRGSTELYSGDRVQLTSFEDSLSGIELVPDLSIAGTPICSRVLPGWFGLSSQTPGVCPIASRSDCVNCLPGTLPDVVSVEQAGPCQLLLDAPQLNAASGLSEQLSVEFLPPG